MKHKKNNSSATIPNYKECQKQTNDEIKNPHQEAGAEETNQTEKEEPTTAEEKQQKLIEELEKSQEKCAELNDKNLRLMAEFDNFRKRTLKEKTDLIKSAGENIFVEILHLIDDFDRATQSIQETKEPEAIKDGLNLIHNKFLKFLKDHAVTEIETIGQTFDMELHEAVSMFAVEDKKKKGKIIDCISKGYKLNDKVIRFPKVVVGE